MFTVSFRGRVLEIKITSDGTEVKLIRGESLEVMIDGELRKLQPAA
jgi:hypothetical protein